MQQGQNPAENNQANAKIIIFVFLVLSLLSIVPTTINIIGGSIVYPENSLIWVIASTTLGNFPYFNNGQQIDKLKSYFYVQVSCEYFIVVGLTIFFILYLNYYRKIRIQTVQLTMKVTFQTALQAAQGIQILQQYMHNQQQIVTVKAISQATLEHLNLNKHLIETSKLYSELKKNIQKLQEINKQRKQNIDRNKFYSIKKSFLDSLEKLVTKKNLSQLSIGNCKNFYVLFKQLIRHENQRRFLNNQLCIDFIDHRRPANNQLHRFYFQEIPPQSLHRVYNIQTSFFLNLICHLAILILMSSLWIALILFSIYVQADDSTLTIFIKPIIFLCINIILEWIIGLAGEYLPSNNQPRNWINFKLINYFVFLSTSLLFLLNFNFILFRIQFLMKLITYMGWDLSNTNIYSSISRAWYINVAPLLILQQFYNIGFQIVGLILKFVKGKIRQHLQRLDRDENDCCVTFIYSSLYDFCYFRGMKDWFIRNMVLGLQEKVIDEQDFVQELTQILFVGVAWGGLIPILQLMGLFRVILLINKTKELNQKFQQCNYKLLTFAISVTLTFRIFISNLAFSCQSVFPFLLYSNQMKTYFVQRLSAMFGPSYYFGIVIALLLAALMIIITIILLVDIFTSFKIFYIKLDQNTADITRSNFDLPQLDSYRLMFNYPEIIIAQNIPKQQASNQKINNI